MSDLSVEQVAALLHRSPVRVRQYCQRGQLRAHKVGRAWIIKEADARAFTPAPTGRPPDEFASEHPRKRRK